jgi:hypothetical protein
MKSTAYGLSSFNENDIDHLPGNGKSRESTGPDYGDKVNRKKTVMVYDYIDSNVPVLMRMYQKRLKGYRAMGYGVKSI